jgi:uncharacterized protein with HEPN domain
MLPIPDDGEADRVRVQHMRDAVGQVLDLSQGRSRSALDDDPLYGLAMVRLIEIVGEAAKNVSVATTALAPDIPWRLLAGTRDRLAHAYFDVNFEIIWQIIQADFPRLLPALDRLLQKISGDLS